MTMMAHVILPQTFRIIAPQIGNTFVANIKDTSVLNVISVTELFYTTNVVAGTYFRMFEAYTITAAIYLTLTLVFNFLLRLLENGLAGSSSYEVLSPESLAQPNERVKEMSAQTTHGNPCHRGAQPEETLWRPSGAGRHLV